jgi:hypothetical protein
MVVATQAPLPVPGEPNEDQCIHKMQQLVSSTLEETKRALSQS